jgi:hypothetical protein
MSTAKEHLDQLASAKAYAAIDHSIKALNVAEVEMENTAIADTPGSSIQKLAKVYTAVKPLLTVVSTLPLFPQAWRAALSLFVAAIEAVVSTASPELNFKAGKDL